MKQEEESRHPRGFVNRSREEKIKRIEENKRVYPISDYRRKTKVGNEGGEKMEISRQHSMRSGVALLRRSDLWARSCLCDFTASHGGDTRATPRDGSGIGQYLATAAIGEKLIPSRESPNERPDRSNTTERTIASSRPDSTSASWNISRRSSSECDLMCHRATARPCRLAGISYGMSINPGDRCHSGI